MGVTGLWSILQPCARPTKIETLNRKRLAVDASIWIYQFLKAVRDKEGNALRNSHVVGFFRRICKLLFFGIKPVFVFDGGAPALKRHVIRERKRRREGRRDDTVRTAGKLLAVQMQRRAEEAEAERREARDRRQDNEEEVPDEGMVYVDELFTAPQDRQEQKTKFRRKDAYHLPDLDVSMSEMTGPNDPRVMSLDELQDYARQFDRGEDINVYDFSKIDYDSPFFTSLPASDRYNILNAARLRSRLRMGHSKEQLDTMFPDRMAFSKFQIERVTERNELTQRLMHVNEGGAGSYDGSSRVAGEKGREYVLVKNDGVEGGWALGVVSNEGRSVNEAIDLDKPAIIKKEESESEEDDFEDVAIEGLNRLPKLKSAPSRAQNGINRQRRALYKSRRRTARRKPKAPVIEDPDSLFVAEEPQDESEEESDVTDEELFGSEEGYRGDDDDLNRAIAMSLQKDGEEEGEASLTPAPSPDRVDDDMLSIFEQKAVSEALPIPQATGRGIANIVNQRAFKAAPESHEITSFGVPVPKPDLLEDVDDSIDLHAALAESRRTKRPKTPPGPRYKNVQPHTPKRTPASATPKKPKLQLEQSATDIAKAHGFRGPLPFESLDLGSSLLGKKKMQERVEQAAGGFEDPALAAQNKRAEPLPPWFSGDLKQDIAKQREVEEQDRQKAKEFNERFRFDKINAPLKRHATNDVIDLDAEDEDQGRPIVVELDADEDDGRGVPQEEATMDDIADDVHRAEPLPSTIPDMSRPEQHMTPKSTTTVLSAKLNPFAAESDDEEVNWSDSDDGKTQAAHVLQEKHIEPMGGTLEVKSVTPEVAMKSPIAQEPARSPSAEFEDIDIPDKPASPKVQVHFAEPTLPSLVPQEGMAEEYMDDFSDPEDEELMRSLAKETEEHARFESTLNQRSVAQNIADYERELKQLRNQQKKDRRDADEVTHVMITECQQLLQLFGLPYITAPMEAEAQCAELVKLGLVDGIVTDDSDCFLFGGTRVYKNVFNQAKFVECYLANDLEKEFDLSRDKMIAVAQLLGSDYTEGLTGVGPVTALEILAEFGDLKAFREWWIGVQNLTISKQDDAGNAFRKKFRKNATKIFLPPAFPDERVSMAYLDPEVDASAEQFQWGVPDLGALRAYLMATIGWSQERTDEILVPVIKDMNRRMDEGTQANITAFFEGSVGAGAAGRGQGGEAFAPRRKIDSNRMGKAMTRLADKAKANRKRAAGEVDAEDEAEDATGDTDASTRSKAPTTDDNEYEPVAKTKTKRTKRSKAAK